MQNPRLLFPLVPVLIMNILPQENFRFAEILLLLALTGVVPLSGQASFQQESQPIYRNKPISDYYDAIDDKSFYQQKRIHGMKSELNNYSKKLHNLQDRFDQIFYGLSSKGNFQSPFDTTTGPVRPVIGTKVETLPQYPAASPIASVIDPPPPEPSSNQLAFNVDSPGKFTEDGKVVSSFDPRKKTANGLGYYLVLSPGVAIPHKIHKEFLSYRRYDPGISATLAGGFNVSGFKIGIGGAYKKHSFHDSSKLKVSPYSDLTGDSETFAGYLDLGYEFELSRSLDAYFGIGVGYYLSLIEDRKNLGSRKEHDVFLTGTTGLAWRFSEISALRLSYRYFHENEAPAHLAELGLNLDF